MMNTIEGVVRSRQMHKLRLGETTLKGGGDEKGQFDRLKVWEYLFLTIVPIRSGVVWINLRA